MIEAHKKLGITYLNPTNYKFVNMLHENNLAPTSDNLSRKVNTESTGLWDSKTQNFSSENFK